MCLLYECVTFFKLWPGTVVEPSVSNLVKKVLRSPDSSEEPKTFKKRSVSMSKNKEGVQ